LIDHALQRLLPDVFFHPIWMRLVDGNVLLSRKQVQSLLDSVDQLLSAGKLHDACQALFICAFQQLRASDYDAASSSIQRILDLSEQHELSHIAACAAWGAAAVNVRRSWYQQAAEHLEHLQSILGEQQEWVLSDVIDVIRQALLSQPEVTALNQLLASDAALSSAFEQLLCWGTPSAASNPSGNDSSDRHGKQDDSATSPSCSTGFSWHSFWQTIKRIAKGELRLTWVEPNGSVPLPQPEERNALISASSVSVTAHSPAPMPHPFDQPPTLDQQSELEQPSAPDQPESTAVSPASHSITAHLLGAFSFSVNDATMQSWPTGKGRAVFKYLLAHHDQPIPRDVLMDAFWPQAGPEAARNSLNVALHGLRQALKAVTDKPLILFEEGAYYINPEFHLWTDVDEFDRHVQAGRRLEAKDQLAHAIAEYEAAIELYQGDFLSGDPYEEWPVLPRERLRVASLDVLDRLSQIYFSQQEYAACVTRCQQILVRDNCREDAHCLLMQCYCRQEQHHLALRQYQTCVDALRSELNVDPAPATTELYERLRRREPV
jgi:DNA-binding SARP family transcriptional activator